MWSLNLQTNLYLGTYLCKVGRSKPPPVLTSGFNRLKPPRSICQKVVNTGQYESEWSIENFKRHFCGGMRYLYRFYVLSIEKRKNIYCFVPAKGIFHGEISISIPSSSSSVTRAGILPERFRLCETATC